MSHAIGVTPIERFFEANDLKPGAVAHEAGISRQHLYRIRKGGGMGFMTALRIRDACGRLLLRHVPIEEIFGCPE